MAMIINKQLLKDSSKHKKIVVDFYATWCKPCVVIKPVLEEAAAKETDIEFVFINVDDYDKTFLKKEFGVIAIPNVQFWTEGKKVDFVVGATDEPTMITKIIKFKQR